MDHVWVRFEVALIPDNPAELEGMPVGLQAVTTRHSEEKALKLTRVIVDALEASKAKKQGGKL